MTKRLSLSEWRAMTQRGHSKYSSEAIVINGRRFDSKLEGERYLYWSNLWHAGAIRFFLTQVPFHLPGSIVLRLDFLVVHLDGSITYEDTKGHLTRVAINKIKQVEEIYRIRIDLIQRERKCKGTSKGKTPSSRIGRTAPRGRLRSTSLAT